MANYGAVIEVSVKGQEALNKLEGSARKIESLIQGIKQQRNIFDQAVGSTKTRELKKNLENLVATFAGAKEGARQFKATIGGNEQTINMYSKTLAGLNHQLQAFRGIANNASVGTDQYRNAVVAANKVSNEFARTQAKAFKVSTDVSRMNVNDVIALGKNIPKTIEGLDFYKGRLEEVLKTVKIGSNDFRALEEAIAGVDVAMGAARLSGQKSAITPAAGPATRLDSVSALEKRARYTQQIADLEYKQLTTGQQLVQAKLTQSQQDELQNRLAQASDALARGELDVAKRLTAELRNQRILYERSNRAQEALMRPSSMTAGAAESVTGKRPGGLPAVPGSPAAYLATGGVQAPAAKAAEQTLNTQVSLQKRLQNITSSGLLLEQKALQYKAQGLTIDHEINYIETLNNRLKNQSGQLTRAELDALDVELNLLRNKLLLEKAVAATRKAQAGGGGGGPAGGGGGKGGGASAGAKGGAFQNALIGGAFPLLFGGGPGAVLGGFGGGFIPGNPMMSIVTSAVGTIFDRIIAGARLAGEAVRTLDTTIQHMSENALFSSKETEFLAKKFEEYGRSSLALQVVQEELNRKIGYEGVASLQNLGDASSKLNRAWADLNLQLQAALAGPLAGLLQFIADVLKFAPSTGAQTDVNAITKNLKPAQAAQFQKEMFATLNGGEAAQKPVIAKYAALAEKQKQNNIKLSNEEIDARIKDGEKLYAELADLERDLNEKKRQYAEQYADMVLALQRQQYDLTEQLQRKAFDTQVQALGKELELLQKQAQIRIEISRNALKEQQLTAAPGTDVATSLMTAIEEYRIRRAEIDNEAENSERQFKLEMIRLDVENERYKLDIAKTIARTNYDSTVKIARINQDINKQNEAVANLNYQRRADILSTELALVRLQAIQELASAEAARELGTLTKDQVNYYNTMIAGAKQVLAESAPLKKKSEQGTLFKVPGGIPQMGAVPQLNADTRGVDAANKSLTDRIAAYQQLVQTSGKLTEQERNRLELLANIEQLAIAPLGQIVKAQNDLIIYQENYNDSIMRGTLPALSEQLAKIEQLTDPALAALNLQIADLEALKAENSALFNQQELLDGLIERRGRLQEFRGDAIAGAIAEQSPEKRLQNAFVGVQAELNNLTDPVNALVTGANHIGTAFGQAFSDIISGSVSAQEAIANMLNSVGQNFIKMAADIIVQQTTMIILGTILKALGISTGGGTSKDSISNFNAGAAQYGGGLAGGGPTRAGTPYLVGERGPELFVPGTNGGVMSNSDLRSSMGAAPGSAAGAPVLNMSFETSTINGVEYVSRDQLEAAMAQTRRQAARDGAQRGMSMTLDKLQQSPSTRKRVGF